MTKRIIANRFGLVALILSLFASTAAFAGGTQSPTPVVVTNTGANPVPVTVPQTQFYQATQTLNCTGAPGTAFTFDVPSGKTLIVRSVNVLAGSHALGDTFGAYVDPDDGSTSFLAFAMQPVGGSYGSFSSTWASNQPVQMLATQYVHAIVSRNTTAWNTACSATVTISGELM